MAMREIIGNRLQTASVIRCLTITTMDDSLLNIKSPPSTSLVSTESATATNLSFSQALGDTTNEEVSEYKTAVLTNLSPTAFNIRSCTAWRRRIAARID